MITINLYQTSKHIVVENQKKFFKKTILCCALSFMTATLINSVLVYEVNQIKKQNQALQNQLQK